MCLRIPNKNSLTAIRHFRISLQCWIFSLYYFLVFCIIKLLQLPSICSTKIGWVIPLLATEELSPTWNILQQIQKILLAILEWTSHCLFIFSLLSKILPATTAKKWHFLLSIVKDMSLILIGMLATVWSVKEGYMIFGYNARSNLLWVVLPLGLSWGHFLCKLYGLKEACLCSPYSAVWIPQWYCMKNYLLSQL